MKSEKPSGEKAEMEQRAIAMLKQDPQMRQYFLNKVARADREQDVRVRNDPLGSAGPRE